ncbi:acetyl-CoA hydrolase/succinyl-CoA:acetate CoA-transferase [Dyadobacter jejuensis]|uniref:Acetyl-CoA hydrolase/succinyl-CoA:acetate CoA-transferase n=1 Tax=Dyadobacter jejuensis TaxID=1082580 RepID=A0A316AGM0_9BACT|nr:succinate CoA transferase [Dyadobacter jejuensis]PWJ56843.1 acetyl-CoA hydrolase/succinyl-CoA:acetate CoA-transferase [Dyadobacter jejuensis]
MTSSPYLQNQALKDRIITADQAAAHIKSGMLVASSGFTKAGDSKAVLLALANNTQNQAYQIDLVTGASLGHDTDGQLAQAGILRLRFPFQVDRTMRKEINKGSLYFIDQHLGETAELLKNGHFPAIDVAILEASKILPDGSFVPTTSVGNAAEFAALAKKVIIEINTSVTADLQGIHDIYPTGIYPGRSPIPITEASSRIGTTAIPLDTDKVIGIVWTDIPDSPADIAEPDPETSAIAGHILDFLHQEVEQGRLTKSLLPLQAGIGKVANSVLHGFADSEFEDLTMYSEVLQDSTFDLFDSGKLLFASAASITLSEAYQKRIFENFGPYKDKILIRPQDVTNAGEVIRRLGVIAINTAIECDIYGNVNSTHISGTHMMNGIGGSGDFARNSALSIFVTTSTSKEHRISKIVPMVTHVDHTEHDVDVIVTEQGLADLRGLAPRQRALRIIENCVHPQYKDELRSYYERACTLRGGQTPHILEEAFDWHRRLSSSGSMKKTVEQGCPTV